MDLMEPEGLQMLQWTEKEVENLCNHVQLHGAKDWKSIAAAVSRFPAELCELKWNVLYLDVLEQAGRLISAHREYTDWEIAVLLRGCEAWNPVGKSKRALYTALACYLPGRTANGVKQAIKKHIEDDCAAVSVRVAQQGWPSTLLGVLNAWPGLSPMHQMCMRHPDEQVAQHILEAAAATAAAAQTAAGVSRKRKSNGSAKQQPLAKPAAKPGNLHIRVKPAMADDTSQCTMPSTAAATGPATAAIPSSGSNLMNLYFGQLGGCNAAGNISSGCSSPSSARSVSTAIPWVFSCGAGLLDQNIAGWQPYTHQTADGMLAALAAGAGGPILASSTAVTAAAPSPIAVQQSSEGSAMGPSVAPAAKRHCSRPAASLGAANAVAADGACGGLFAAQPSSYQQQQSGHAATWCTSVSSGGQFLLQDGPGSCCHPMQQQHAGVYAGQGPMLQLQQQQPCAAGDCSSLHQTMQRPEPQQQHKEQLPPSGCISEQTCTDNSPALVPRWSSDEFKWDDLDKLLGHDGVTAGAAEPPVAMPWHSGDECFDCFLNMPLEQLISC